MAGDPAASGPPRRAQAGEQRRRVGPGRAAVVRPASVPLWAASASTITWAPARTWPCRLVALRQNGDRQQQPAPSSRTASRRDRGRNGWVSATSGTPTTSRIASCSVPAARAAGPPPGRARLAGAGSASAASASAQRRARCGPRRARKGSASSQRRRDHQRGAQHRRGRARSAIGTQARRVQRGAR